MLTNGVISVVLIFVVLGCTNFSDRRHRFVEAKDDRLAGSPYVQELVEKVQGQWDPPGARQKDKIFAGTIVDVSFSIEAMDGAIAAIKPIPARNQLV
jgi:hypothetical protein